ncbi:MAG TPA: hypothetical protein VG125_09745 [Pirellulales bacterium]|jgi:hypothetical protein|nr:hypothetical protein [Pirellulales bacterium]
MKYRLTLFCAVALLGCKAPFSHNLPPAEQIMHPGPGVDGPGPGVMMLGDPGPSAMGAATQAIFAGPEGMIITWDVSAPGAFDSEPLVAPGRYNFPQGAIYRLKLTNIPGREGVELYPTLEIAPSLPRTDAYLAHNGVPIQFTEEDFDQVLSGNFVTKVIYLPDLDFQELALAGVETLVSTRLDPGLDPIVEADRRGAILAIIRVGNKDLQVGGQEQMAGGGMGGMQMGGPGYCGPNGMPPAFMAGVTAPEYGMPMSGTPIGLPGPPHVPLGIPAGLQRHTIKNHTHVHIPQPVEKVGITVKQTPGLSYPKPVRHVYIHEQARAPWLNFHMPWRKKHQAVRPDVPCDDGQCVQEEGQPTYTAANPEGPASAPDYVSPPDVH